LGQASEDEVLEPIACTAEETTMEKKKAAGGRWKGVREKRKGETASSAKKR